MRDGFSRCQHLSIISSRFISEKTKLTVFCASTQQNSACPPRPRRAVVCLTAPAGIKAEGLAHARQSTGASPQCPWAPRPVSALESGAAPWASMRGIRSGVVGSARGPPRPVSTLESWAPGQMETCGHLITIYKYPKGRLREEEVIKFHVSGGRITSGSCFW